MLKTNSIFRWRNITLALAMLVMNFSSWAIDSVLNDMGLAIGGYDPVAYFTEQRAVRGNPKFTYQWQDVTWQFDSNSNKMLFISDPIKYSPQYGGYCAYAIAKDAIVPGDPKVWTVTDNKLYFNYSPKIEQRWLLHIQGYTARANKKWPQLKKE